RKTRLADRRPQLRFRCPSKAADRPVHVRTNIDRSNPDTPESCPALRAARRTHLRNGGRRIKSSPLVTQPPFVGFHLACKSAELLVDIETTPSAAPRRGRATLAESDRQL